MSKKKKPVGNGYSGGVMIHLRNLFLFVIYAIWHTKPGVKSRLITWRVCAKPSGNSKSRARFTRIGTGDCGRSDFHSYQQLIHNKEN
ncbi:MAG: hypothetical protein ACYTEQ_09485 [Planctomycetota bacterium]